jgi:hypothetical protein
MTAAAINVSSGVIGTPQTPALEYCAVYQNVRVLQA